MTTPVWAVFGVVVVWVLLLESCWMPMRKKALPPPAPEPSNLPVQTVPAPRIEPPPEIVVPPVPVPPAPELPNFPKAKAESQPQHPPRQAPAAETAAPQETAPPAVPEPSRIPQLTPMLSEEERRAYNAALDELLLRTSQNMSTARQRPLDSRRRDLLARAANFAEQARELRQTDPAGAKSLAERAEMMSREAAER